MNSTKSLIIWGGTGQCKVVYEALDKKQYHLSAIFDNRELAESPLDGVPCFNGYDGFEDWLKNNTSDFHYFVVAIGGSGGADRILISKYLKEKKLMPLDVVHKTAYLTDGVLFGEGLQMMAMSIVGANSSLGENVIINTSASVDHDCQIGDGVHIGPGATLAGEVVVEELAFIGAGAVVLPRFRIGRAAIVGAGAVVTKDIPPNVVVVGNPARSLIKK